MDDDDASGNHHPDASNDPAGRVRSALCPSPPTHRPDASPYREPWRRWGQASTLYAADVPEPEWPPDPLVRRTVRFIAAADPTLDEPLWDAFDVFTGPRLRRAHLDAYLLTTLPNGEVAARTGHPPGVVTLYAGVFCDLADQLSCRDWVSRYVTGGGRAAHDDLGALWKLHAYAYGAAALDAVVTASVRARLVGKIDGWAPPPATVPRKRLAAARRAVLALTLSQDKTDELALLVRAVGPAGVWFRRANGVTTFGVKNRG